MTHGNIKNLLLLSAVSSLLCILPARAEAEDAYLRSQREQTLAGVVQNACNGPGRVDDKAVFVTDLTQDGTDDFIVDESGITCGKGGMSINCGAQVCTARIFVFESEYFVENLATLGTITKIVSGEPPAIEIYRHGGAVETIRWRGNAFQ